MAWNPANPNANAFNSSDVEEHRSDLHYEQTTTTTPEKILLQAIVERALIDAFAPPKSDVAKKTGKWRNIPREAMAWLRNSNSTEIFSFGYCIQHLGLSNRFILVAQRAINDEEFRAHIARHRAESRESVGRFAVRNYK